MSKTDTDRYMTICQIAQLYRVRGDMVTKAIDLSSIQPLMVRGRPMYRHDDVLDEAINEAIITSKSPLAKRYIANAALNNVLLALGVRHA